MHYDGFTSTSQAPFVCVRCGKELTGPISCRVSMDNGYVCDACLEKEGGSVAEEPLSPAETQQRVDSLREKVRGWCLNGTARTSSTACEICLLLWLREEKYSQDYHSMYRDLCASLEADVTRIKTILDSKPPIHVLEEGKATLMVYEAALAVLKNNG